MNKIQTQFAAMMVVLTGLALYLAAGAAHRGEATAAFVMLIIAAIFWAKVQKKS